MRTQSHRLSKVVKVGATVVVFGLVAGACGSDKNTDTTEPSSTTTTEISGEKPVIGGTLLLADARMLGNQGFARV